MILNKVNSHLIIVYPFFKVLIQVPECRNYPEYCVLKCHLKGSEIVAIWTAKLQKKITRL